MSVLGSEPSTLARNSRRSVSFTVTVLAPLTTWALVSMTPSGLTMKPEPSPRIGTSRCGMRPPPMPGMPKRRKNSKNGSSGSMPCPPRGCWCWAEGVSSSSSSSPPLYEVLVVPVTLMFTTAGPLSAVICAKSGADTPEYAAGAAATGPVAAGGTAAWLECRLVTSPAPVAPHGPGDHQGEGQAAGGGEDRVHGKPFRWVVA